MVKERRKDTEKEKYTSQSLVNYSVENFINSEIKIFKKKPTGVKRFMSQKERKRNHQ